MTPEAWDLAKACFESAIELDPAFALAHVGLGYYSLGQLHFGRSPAHEAIPESRAAARRALGCRAPAPGGAAAAARPPGPIWTLTLTPVAPLLGARAGRPAR